MTKRLNWQQENIRKKIYNHGTEPYSSGRDAPTKTHTPIPDEILALKGLKKLRTQNKVDLRKFFERSDWSAQLNAIKLIFSTNELEAQNIVRAIKKAHQEQDTFIPWPMDRYNTDP